MYGLVTLLFRWYRQAQTGAEAGANDRTIAGGVAGVQGFWAGGSGADWQFKPELPDRASQLSSIASTPCRLGVWHLSPTFRWWTHSC